jgi:hypothetical protein
MEFRPPKPNVLRLLALKYKNNRRVDQRGGIDFDFNQDD